MASNGTGTGAGCAVPYGKMTGVFPIPEGKGIIFSPPQGE